MTAAKTASTTIFDFICALWSRDHLNSLRDCADFGFSALSAYQRGALQFAHGKWDIASGGTITISFSVNALFNKGYTGE